MKYSPEVASFPSELQLGNVYSKLLMDEFSEFDGNVHFKMEVKAPGCIPDMIVFVECQNSIEYIITFEFKLRKWKRALNQAFRHRNFCNETYVVLDHSHAKSAISNKEKFRKANIGLITIDTHGKRYTWVLPKPSTPFSNKFSHNLASTLLSIPQNVSIEMPFVKSTVGGERFQRN